MNKNHYKIISRLRLLGPVDFRARFRVWLKSGPNFTAARKAVLAMPGVGQRSWEEFLECYGLKEVVVAADITEETGMTK